MADPQVLHTNPNVPQDEDGTGSEALFAGLNDEHVIIIQNKTLAGNSETLDGPAEAIEVIAPLLLQNRQLSLGPTNSPTGDDLSAERAARIAADNAQELARITDNLLSSSTVTTSHGTATPIAGSWQYIGTAPTGYWAYTGGWQLNQDGGTHGAGLDLNLDGVTATGAATGCGADYYRLEFIANIPPTATAWGCYVTDQVYNDAAEADFDASGNPAWLGNWAGTNWQPDEFYPDSASAVSMGGTQFRVTLDFHTHKPIAFIAVFYTNDKTGAPFLVTDTRLRRSTEGAVAGLLAQVASLQQQVTTLFEVTKQFQWSPASFAGVGRLMVPLGITETLTAAASQIALSGAGSMTANVFRPLGLVANFAGSGFMYPYASGPQPFNLFMYGTSSLSAALAIIRGASAQVMTGSGSLTAVIGFLRGMTALPMSATGTMILPNLQRQRPIMAGPLAGAGGLTAAAQNQKPIDPITLSGAGLMGPGAGRVQWILSANAVLAGAGAATFTVNRWQLFGAPLAGAGGIVVNEAMHGHVPIPPMQFAGAGVGTFNTIQRMVQTAPFVGGLSGTGALASPALSSNLPMPTTLAGAGAWAVDIPVYSVQLAAPISGMGNLTYTSVSFLMPGVANMAGSGGFAVDLSLMKGGAVLAHKKRQPMTFPEAQKHRFRVR